MAKTQLTDNALYNALEEVIDFYDQGGGGNEVKESNTVFGRLETFTTRKKEVAAFIKALDSE